MKVTRGHLDWLAMRVEMLRRVVAELPQLLARGREEGERAERNRQRAELGLEPR